MKTPRKYDLYQRLCYAVRLQIILHIIDEHEILEKS